jgi:alkylhydroperoxidase family enzyme
MNSSDTTSAQTTATAYPSLAADEDASLQEASHVFSCMQCDLQFLVDMACRETSTWQLRVCGPLRVQQFSEQELVNLTLAVVVIYGWNRFAISFHTVPGTYQSKQH